MAAGERGAQVRWERGGEARGVSGPGGAAVDQEAEEEGGDVGQGSSYGRVCGGHRGGGVQEGYCFAARVWAVGDGGMGCEGGLSV